MNSRRRRDLFLPNLRNSRRVVGLLAFAILGSTTVVSSRALAEHSTSLPATAAATGPTFIHDQAFAGATISVKSIPVPLTTLTIVVLDVKNMPAIAQSHVLGAHVHSGACATDPAASGGHHQNPAVTDPSVSVSAKEVWLDLNVDGVGRATSIALIDWRLRKGQAGSVVIHALPTNATTGAAGARVLCTTVPFND